MKKIKYLIIIFIAIFSFNTNCFAKVKTYTRSEKDYLVPSDVKVVDSNKKAILDTPAVAGKDKIYDFAELLSEDDEKKLYQKINDFYNKSGIEIVIVLTDNLNGYGILNYAYNFYDYNEFDEDGVVFVISTASKEPEIFMGNCGDKDDPNAKALSIYTDERVNDTLAYVYKSVKEKKYYTALSDFIKIVDGFYDIDDNGGGAYKVDKKGNLIKSIPWLDIIILSIALTFVIVSIFIFLIKKRNKTASNTINIGDKVDNSTLSVKCDNDMPVITNDSNGNK
jgi:uncharacterized membrane protein YgcG